jgi:prepilin-type processing-associated H-X9-DG protein
MASTTGQPELFEKQHAGGVGHGVVTINHRCRFETRDGYRVVNVAGIVVAHYAVGDRMAEAHAMVSLVEQGCARQMEVARAFGCDVRTVRRNQQRFEDGGLVALGRPRGYPRGRTRLSKGRKDKLNAWKAEGVPNREIARRLGVSEKAVRKLARGLGWAPSRAAEQMALSLGDADPKVSASAPLASDEPPGNEPGSSSNAPQPLESTAEPAIANADPKLSASSTSADHRLPLSLDADPTDRGVDRLLARLGLLDDAAPRFSSGTQVSGAGVLLAIPALVDSGVFNVAREIYGSIGPAFYGLRTTLTTLLLMALLRIKRPEGLKERSPQQLGRIFGLDRAPEVKTLRRKLTRLAAYRRVADLGRALAEQRVATHGHAMGFLYVDGHVRVYHGKRELPKTHVVRMRISMPATTDYWVNDAEGEPLFVVPTEANKGLAHMLPVVLAEVRSLVGKRRVTVVFDRGGWSPKLFAKLLADGFDILTYRKAPYARVPTSCFRRRRAVFDGRKVSYRLADQGVYLGYGPVTKRRRLHLRQVTRLTDDGHQTPIITSRRDLRAVEVAYRMFERWRQENFFKYLREEFALDALVDYGAEPADAARSVPNPQRKKIDAELRKANAALGQLQSEYGLEALINREQVRRTMRGFKIANAELSDRVLTALKHVIGLEKKRAWVPARVPVNEVVTGDVVKLTVERKHLTDILKMVAYQAEGDLFRLLAPHYRRTEDEGRTLVQSALMASADLGVTDDELRVAIEPLSSPHKTKALVAICDDLNATSTCFPGTKLRLRFSVKSEPPKSLAFPGPRPPRDASEQPQPDISRGA